MYSSTSLGAKIKINSDNDTSNIQRCDITGTQSQIEYAKQLINEKIVEEKEFRTKRQDSRQGTYYIYIMATYFFFFQSILIDK